ncbi:uncharacterized protein B0H18DRAFT_1090055 [Fomitopsis serialis]|uniref:uncharacterized protein n=1 Tax=Fomitopsis serialis TaxID=139415 RepID=UPI0020074235|nr:uncharacterized protein B0H18DRAFT_1090055 [Neoantrodia serialis]KAH9910220.1 hypothetical protein B0H18DRAFT_1090055 [Neoantrodia serialis]
MFILDMLDNLPRLRLSSDHFKVVLWALRELGVSGVPTFSKFRKTQDHLNHQTCGVHTDVKHSPQGDIFYQNRVSDLLALDYANPQTRPHGHTHWYIGELAMLASGKLVIPHTWYRYQSQGEVYGEGYEVMVTDSEQGGDTQFDVRLDTLVEFKTSDLHINYPELESNGLGNRLSCESHDQYKQTIKFDDRLIYLLRTPATISGPLPKGIYNGCNPLRDIAKGRRMYTSYVKAWGDDVSGNKSKQYNEHTNIYLAHANLPHTKLSQEYFVRFCSTSPHANAGAQFDAMVDSEVLFRVIPCLFPADNPQQSENCSHIGLHGNMWCRRCKLGGSEKERETDQNYHAHFDVDPNNLRTAQQTRDDVLTQIRLAALGVKKDVTQRQTETGTKDKLAEHWIKILLDRARDEQQRRITTPATADARLKGVHGGNRTQVVLVIKKEIQAELLEWVVTQPPETYNKLPPESRIDIHRETPVELLHTYLLGQDKYVWHFTHSSWSPKQFEMFAVRLQSSSVDGLNILPIRARYIIQYKDNLIGKHFKALQQLGIFHLDDTISATGELGALLWFTEIEDMDMYLADLKTLIANVLDIWSQIDPKRIFVKPKLHLLLHLLFDIRDQGPAGLYATEIFECFNAIFRMCSVLSNHQAPSRDIAWACADMDRFKHQVSGGWWKDPSGKFVQAGERVRRYFDNDDVQRRLGHASQASSPPGTIHRRKTESQITTWEAVSSDNQQHDDKYSPQSQWFTCLSVIARTGDVCRVGSWIFYDFKADTTRVGRIKAILQPTTGPANQDDTIIVEQFSLANSRHPHFGMPELFKIDINNLNCVSPSDVISVVNVQHNCIDGGCEPTGRKRRKQERTLTEIEEPYIEHKDDTRYIINTHALHNAALLRKILPRHLTAPIPYIDPELREAAHHRMAASLRAVQDVRRTKEAEAPPSASTSGSHLDETLPSQSTNSRPAAPRPQPRKRARLESTTECRDSEGGDGQAMQS